MVMILAAAWVLLAPGDKEEKIVNLNVFVCSPSFAF
jgi:hypothetical protein